MPLLAEPASYRVAQRAGFAAEGTKGGEGHHADGWHDMHLHAHLDSDAATEAIKAVDVTAPAG
ncbi:GNAT family N-acetyltransferase [Micromonospora inositola]|uniref:hypothetical protein n=1 Tax=Micromonospora inositola TaxID=47865 RepID=UPI000B5AD604|nr:hypothetical protein [Micromonospora inositola]